MENLQDILDLLPSISEQVEIYRSGKYDELVSKEKAEQIEAATRTPSIHVWVLRLVTMDEADSDDATKVCGAIEVASTSEAPALAKVLRNSIVRNGKGLVTDQPRPKMRGVALRFVVFFMVEKFRLVGLTRDQAIDCVSKMSDPGGTAILPTPKTIESWYCKKHGIEYTGIRRLAQLIVGRPNGLIGGLMMLWCRMVARNMLLIKKLRELSVITDDEYAEVRLGIRWLHGSATACWKIFSSREEEFDYARIEKRLKAIDEDSVIRDAIPVLLGSFWSSDSMNGAKHDLHKVAGKGSAIRT